MCIQQNTPSKTHHAYTHTMLSRPGRPELTKAAANVHTTKHTIKNTPCMHPYNAFQAWPTRTYQASVSKRVFAQGQLIFVRTHNQNFPRGLKKVCFLAYKILMTMQTGLFA